MYSQIPNLDTNAVSQCSQPRCFSKIVTPICELTIKYFMRSIPRSLETVVLREHLDQPYPNN